MNYLILKHFISFIHLYYEIIKKKFKINNNP